MKTNKETELKRKSEINKELISNDLSKYLKTLIVALFVGGIFGYLGYLYAKDNNEDIRRGIIFGIVFSLGIVPLKITDAGFFSFVIYVIIWICIIDYIPLWIGIAIILIIISVFIYHFINIKNRDRTKEINILYEDEVRKNKSKENFENPEFIRKTSKNYLKNNTINSIDYQKNKNSPEEELYNDNNELEYECERCFKKISFEEWDEYDMMCEDCFTDVHTDDKGNYHDEEIIDKL